MKKLISIVAIVFLFIPFMFAQKEVLMVDGSVYKSDGNGIVDENKVLVYNNNNNKLKSRLIDTSEVFAIINDNDTMFLYDYSNYPLEEAKLFVQGQIDGKNYRNIKANIAAFTFGVASPIIVYFLSISPSLLPLIPATGTIVLARVNTDKTHKSFDSSYRDDKSYKRWYRLSASKEKVKDMSICSAAGLFTGISAMLFLAQSSCY